jgi:hypothetical protein
MGSPLSSQTSTGIFKPLDCFLPRPVLRFTFWVFLAGCFAGMLDVTREEASALVVKNLAVQDGYADAKRTSREHRDSVTL